MSNGPAPRPPASERVFQRAVNAGLQRRHARRTRRLAGLVAGCVALAAGAGALAVTRDSDPDQRVSVQEEPTSTPTTARRARVAATTTGVTDSTTTATTIAATDTSAPVAVTPTTRRRTPTTRSSPTTRRPGSDSGGATSGDDAPPITAKPSTTTPGAVTTTQPTTTTTAAPGAPFVSGKVRASSGEAIAGMCIRAWSEDGTTLAAESQPSGSGGGYLLSVEPGQYHLQAIDCVGGEFDWPPMMYENRLTLSPSLGKEVDLVPGAQLVVDWSIPHGGRFTVRVRRAADGTPVAGAQICPWMAATFAQTQVCPGTTDANGELTALGMAPTSTKVSVDDGSTRTWSGDKPDWDTAIEFDVPEGGDAGVIDILIP